MMRTLLVRGLIAGVIAGIAAALFALVVGEPHVEAAIAIEEANAAADAGEAAGAAHSHGEDVHSHADAAAGHAHDAEEEPLVSRPVQKFIGMPVAQVAYGAALGGLFALAFAFVYGRFGSSSVRAYSAVLAADGFVAVTLVPFLKYPANPPAVGQPGTIGSRTELFFSFLGISVIAAGLAAYAAMVLADRFGRWTAGTLAVGGYLAVVAACGLLLPPVNEVPADFPPSVLWDFRIASIGTIAVLWLALGLAFGMLVHRALRTAPAEQASAAA